MMFNREHRGRTCHAVALANADPYKFPAHYDVLEATNT
jgi:hypothetical protein